MRRFFRSLLPRLSLTGLGPVFWVLASLLGRCGNPGEMGSCPTWLGRRSGKALGSPWVAIWSIIRPRLSWVGLRDSTESAAFRESRTRGALAPLVLFLSGAVGYGEVSEGGKA